LFPPELKTIRIAGPFGRIVDLILKRNAVLVCLNGSISAWSKYCLLSAGCVSRVTSVDVKVEMDDDLHLAFQDATGDKAGIVVCEIPAKQQWCSMRETVFSWTTTRFPFHASSDRKLKLIEAPIITVTGKAYWDVGHAPKDQSNRRSHLPGYAAWEIHPVMKLDVQSDRNARASGRVQRVVNACP